MIKYLILLLLLFILPFHLKAKPVSQKVAPIQISSYIENQETAYLIIQGRQSHKTQKMRIKTQQQVLYTGQLKNDNEIFTIKIFTPMVNNQLIEVWIDDKLVKTLVLGFVVHRKVYRMPFEHEIREFEQSDLKNPPDKGGIVFIGSSSIKFWDTLKQDMAPLTVIQRGFGGSQAQHAVFYADRIVIPYQPKAIVFYEGDNDLAQRKKPKQFLQDCQQFVAKVHAVLPKTKIYFVSIKPSPSRYFIWNEMQIANVLLKAYTQQNELLEFIDVSQAMHDESGQLRTDIFESDQLHLNAKGYQLWATLIKDHLKPLLANNNH